jgi:hypothetical protein
MSQIFQFGAGRKSDGHQTLFDNTRGTEFPWIIRLHFLHREKPT